MRGPWHMGLFSEGTAEVHNLKTAEIEMGVTVHAREPYISQPGLLLSHPHGIPFHERPDRRLTKPRKNPDEKFCFSGKVKYRNEYEPLHWLFGPFLVPILSHSSLDFFISHFPAWLVIITVTVRGHIGSVTDRNKDSIINILTSSAPISTTTTSTISATVSQTKLIHCSENKLSRALDKHN